MNLENEFNKLETTLNFLHSKMALLVDGDESAQQHQMAYLYEEIDLTKTKLLDIEMKILLSTLSNEEEDESIQ